MARDVTEHRTIARKLEEAKRMSSLGQVAASLAHEFNNVLMGIQPFIDLLTKRAGSDPAVKLAAPRISDAGTQAGGLREILARWFSGNAAGLS